MNQFDKYKTILNDSWEVTLFNVIDLLRTLELEFEVDLKQEKDSLLFLMQNKKTIDIKIINSTIESIYKKIDSTENEDIVESLNIVLKDLFAIKTNFNKNN